LPDLLVPPSDGAALLLGAAAFLAGLVNAVAGGGSFLTLPALVLAGVPPVTANATGTVALLPGYVSGAWGLRDAIRPPAGLPLAALLTLCLLGGAAGAGLLLVTSNETFRFVIPWLMLAATALFAWGPRLVARLSARPGEGVGPVLAGLAVLATSVYGGYFNGGLGILLLACFGALGESDLSAMNGLKNLVSAVLTAIAVLLYAWGGAVAWEHAPLMAVAATLGGYAGARGSRHVSPRVLRGFIILTGLGGAAAFFLGY
jgi:hypothetical protein